MVQIGEHYFYSSGEASRLLGVTTRTLQRWTTDEDSRPKSMPELKPVTALNGRRLFRSEEIHQIVERTYGIQLDHEKAKRMLISRSPRTREMMAV